ncbi:ribosome biogenesis GTPase [Thermonema lapsum]|uniref:Small ribosomal subunit biogenesis GTPase RsgA n=1 Tax=Thermonema lapsum TaxID=28195 RepID=A0A846MQL8_9BACT|nr:ribosome small subunit-dependent GTPase A [Thermonema lapsum]NIK73567.1 ribosome biogenesis GTPase [Thermonema lapsum]
MEGIVLRSTGSWYDVRTPQGDSYKCRLRGKLRLKGFKTTNPVAVGDRVHFEIEDEASKSGLIVDIEARRNYIIRQSVHRTAHAHLIACNIDQAILIATLAMPRTSFGFIDRFLVSCEAYDVPAVIVFNKTDILTDEGLAYQAEIMDMYTSIGYRCLDTSVTKHYHIDEFRALLDGKISLLSGHSGVGKSSLINAIKPELNLKTSEISHYSQKGKHTTTFAEMFELWENTFIIDTPGIKEMGLVDISPQELSHYFPEMRQYLGECKFHNCMHVHEPGCAVREAFERGEIADTRYHSYLSMLENHDNRR